MLALTATAVLAGARAPAGGGLTRALAAPAPPDGPLTATYTVTDVTVPDQLPPPVVAPPKHRHVQAGVASWFDFTRGTCASRTIAKGTIVTVSRPGTGLSVACRVADWGPGDTSRIIDLSRDVFAALAGPGTGLIDVRLAW